jgi:hypothetical protein
MKKLIETMNTLEGHGLCRIIAKTEVKLLVKGRSSTKGNIVPVPKELEGLTRYYQIVASVGHSYSTGVKNQIKKAGGDPTLWVDEECKYSERDPESTNGIIRRHKTRHEEKYLRYFPELMGDTHGKGFYLNAQGDDVTSLITPQIEAEFFADYKKEPSLKQSEVMASQEIGLEKEVKPRNLKAENLLYFKRGEVTFTGTISEEILDMFTLLNDGKCPVAC